MTKKEARFIRSIERNTARTARRAGGTITAEYINSHIPSTMAQFLRGAWMSLAYLYVYGYSTARAYLDEWREDLADYGELDIYEHELSGSECVLRLCSSFLPSCR